MVMENRCNPVAASERGKLLLLGEIVPSDADLRGQEWQRESGGSVKVLPTLAGCRDWLFLSIFSLCLGKPLKIYL